MDDEGELMKVYTDIGFDVGCTDTGEEIITLLLPTETSHIDDVFDAVSMTLAAAKSLAIDLRDAIDAAVEHKLGDK